MEGIAPPVSLNQHRHAAAGARDPHGRMAELDAERGEQIVEQWIGGGADEGRQRGGDGAEQLGPRGACVADGPDAEVERLHLEAVHVAEAVGE